ncbi:hypothetical protein GCM10027043_00610 [Ferruginibacter profundus]
MLINFALIQTIAHFDEKIVFNKEANILTAREIITNKEIIYQCAKAFRTDANTLMLALAREFDFSIDDCGAWPSSVYNTSHNNKGILNREWTFYLHGSHCRFDNLHTGQAVEVLYTEKPEFGILNGFFFYKYMQTTEEFKGLAARFIDYLNVYKAIDILCKEDILTKIPGNGPTSYIIAL